MADVSAVLILAGGQSSRMGSAKALLTLPTGESLLDFHICHAKSLNVPVMVADNDKGFCQDADVRLVKDYLPNDSMGKGAGVLSAIAGAMQALLDEQGYLLVISCDSLIGAKCLFDTLVAKSNQKADVIYIKGDKDYPLLGLYSTDLKGKLQSYLDSGERSVIKFLSEVTVKTANLPNEWKGLANVNSRGEFEMAKKKLKGIFDE